MRSFTVESQGISCCNVTSGALSLQGSSPHSFMFTHLEQALNTSVPTCTVLIVRYVGNSNGDRRMKGSFCVGDLNSVQALVDHITYTLSKFPFLCLIVIHCLTSLLEKSGFLFYFAKIKTFPET